MRKLAVISGAAGMSGNETVRQLLGKNYRVVGFDNFFASSPDALRDVMENPDFLFLEYDLCNFNQMHDLDIKIEKLMQTNEFDELSFINYAAVVHTIHFYKPDDTFPTNVTGMKLFLEMAVRLKADIFINCSTSEVYSMSSFKENGVTESDPLSLVTAETSLRTSYAAGKLMTEFFMKDAVERSRIKGCSIRFANVYSNDELMPVHIIPYAIDSLLKENSITLLENAGSTYRTFLHNYDSCSSVISLLENKSALDGSVYNVGTQEEILITDLIQMIGKELGYESVNILFNGKRSADPPRRMLNTDKINGRTGWHPTVKLLDGIRMCIKTKAAGLRLKSEENFKPEIQSGN